MKKIILLLLILFFVILQAAARDIYVSPGGAASGDGATSAAPINYTRLVAILGTTINDGEINVYFAGGTYTVSANLNSQLSNSRFNGKVLNFIGAGPETDMNTNPAILDGGRSLSQLLNQDQSRNNTANLFTFTIRNMILQNFSTSSGSDPFLRISGTYNTIELNKVTIRNCNNSSSNTDSYLFYLSSAANSSLKISNSSIINNNRGGADLIRHNNAGTFLFYNNTVSGNTCPYAIYINSNSNTIAKIFNNTIYNAGMVNLPNANGTIRFINNIVDTDKQSGVTSESATATTRCKNNIIEGRFYASGLIGSAETTFDNDFYPNLTKHSAPGAQYYRIRNAGASTHSIFGRGMDRSSLYTETTESLETDQREKARPATGGLAMGPIDVNHIFTKDTIIYIIKQEGQAATTQLIDLRECVEEIRSAMLPLAFSLPTQMLPGGTLSPLSGSQTTFTLGSGESSGTYTFAYDVSNNGGTITDRGYVTLIVSTTTTATPPGKIDPSDFNTCFAYMGAVNFTSDYRFITSYYGSNPPEDWSGGRINRQEDCMVGFSIPYVADLNHDGYPEVIGIGQSDQGSSLNGDFRYVYIYDGRTGLKLAKLPFITSTGAETGAFTSSGYHVSPSIGALVDSDRDGVVEIIVAFPGGGGASALRSKVVSYNIRPSGSTYTLEYRWESADTYIRNVAAGTDGSSNFEKPNPQVVDLNGDGIPEVLVYNKVYNAVNGDLLLELETMGTGTSDTNWPTAYLGSSVNATGGGAGYDRYVAFPYIYDMNLDGIYDIVAGGKIYKIRTDALGALPGRPGSGFSADKIELSGVGDGYTGVGDIDGDGKADIVVVSRAGTSGWYNSSDVVVKAWTPDFDNYGTPSPKLIAPTLTIKFEGHVSGSGDPGTGSYVFIGDIDGREQEYNGKTYRLPEIAVLTARISTTTSDFPRHPNISGISTGNGGIPTSSMASDVGALFALTFDPSDKSLKGSFILEHKDRSINTGFTMFDFDNDGVQEICYRDMKTLRIIKPTIPYVKDSYTTSTHPDVIKFSKACLSYTGFEYPVIADIDNDASAEMLVVGQDLGAYAFGYIYAVGNGSGDKFAPALPVWNQFMYDPFKINPDLTTPVGPAANRLSEGFTFRREIKNENNQVVKTIDRYQPFNGTLTQAPYYIGIETTTGQLPDFEPIVFLTEAYIVDNDDPVVADRPQITGTASPYYIEITIGNRSTAKTDIPASTPIAVYKNNRISEGMQITKVPLSTLSYWTGSAWAAFGTTKSISHGETVRVRIPITDPEDIYVVRLGDNSGIISPEATWRWRWGLNDATAGSENPNLGIGVASRQYRDCDWNDQVVRAAKYQLLDDTQTVQEYGSVVINIWENDILPNSYFAANLTIPEAINRDSMQITMQPVAGTLAFSGTGRNSRIEYRHNGTASLTNAIDSFRYAVKFWDSSRGRTHRDTAVVYIYVIESATHGFAACYGQQTTITLANKPAGVAFDWYKATDDDVLIGQGLMRTASFMADSAYHIHPIMPDGAFKNLDFPHGLLTVSLATSPTGTAVMRWTGLEDHNWKNPANWVEVKGSYETPVSWAPTSCVDVIIPSGATNYPELVDAAWCRKIAMKDRAMLKNPHVLNYTAASVELKLTPAEKDRFIMWSAPLKDMYSGDYHIKKTDGSPNWGDAYMMFFQMSNPDVSGNTAVAHRMTATVGNPGVSLPLGTAFNFRLAATSLNRDSTLTFPKAATSYTGANGPVYSGLSRTNKDRFIVDKDDLLSNGTFDLPVKNNAGSSPRILQVVNPYMAWLNVGQFISNNTASLLANAYLAWDGNVNTGIVSYYTQSNAEEMRYWIPSAETATGTSAGMIAPLKSFFVIRKETTSPAPSMLKMSPAWTTTSGAGTQNPYVLRAAASLSPSLLYIKASQGEKTGSTLLRYDPQAIANYRDSEDVYQLFYDGTDGTDGVALTLYSMAPWGEMLAVNSSGNFESREVPLGLRVRDAGEVKLDFSGLPTFGHDVWLIDKTLNKETDLQKNSSYTFTVAKTGNRPLDVNERFSLRLKYTGKGLTGNESAPLPSSLPQWVVSSRDRCIYVQSTSDEIRDLQVYDVTGALIYRSQGLPSVQFRIPVVQGIYIVRAQLDDTHQTEKVMVR